MSLANPRHELFARALARGQTASDAYVTAGYSRHSRWASELARTAEVRDRVADLQEQAARRVELTVDRVTERLLEIAAKAAAREDAGSLSVARACLVDASRLNGLTAEKGPRLAQVLEGYLDRQELGCLAKALPYPVFHPRPGELASATVHALTSPHPALSRIARLTSLSTALTTRGELVTWEVASGPRGLPVIAGMVVTTGAVEAVQPRPPAAPVIPGFHFIDAAAVPASGETRYVGLWRQAGAQRTLLVGFSDQGTHPRIIADLSLPATTVAGPRFSMHGDIYLMVWVPPAAGRASLLLEVHWWPGGAASLPRSSVEGGSPQALVPQASK